MSYGHAVLGESNELYKEAAEWGKSRKQRMEKNQKARAIIWDSLAPMLEEKRKMIEHREAVENK